MNDRDTEDTEKKKPRIARMGTDKKRRERDQVPGASSESSFLSVPIGVIRGFVY
jgi:hypothetical protein